jgi:uncharacterized membrane protein
MRSMNLLALATLLSALGCGLIAGLFFAFSTAVMKALGQQPSQHGIAAMQAINVVILNPWFMTAFLGTGLVCLLLAIASVLHWPGPGSAYLLAGCVLYLLGSIGVTMIFNVPRNNLLANAAASSDEAARLWASYLVEWTRWNHVRMLASLAASASFILALRASAA